MSLLNLTCPRCGSPFCRTVSSYNRSLKRNNGQCFCSSACGRRYPLNTCSTCGDKTKNKKYCNQSCAAIGTNALRKKKRLCLDCEMPIKRNRTRCMPCSKLIQSAGTQQKRQSTHAKIRCASRQVTRTWKQVCAICGYDKHVETCHRKPVSKFPPETLISVINHPSNLVLLCGNHHWELDHSMVTLDGLEPSISSL